MGDQSALDTPVVEQARRVAASSHALSAQDAAAATTEQQTLAATDMARQLQGYNEQDASVALVSKKCPAKHQQAITGSRVASADHTIQVHVVVPVHQAVKKKSNQPRKQLHVSQESSAQAANDSAGKFVGFQS